MVVGRQRIYHRRDRLRQLRVFCRAVEQGSISQAAESLGLSQSAVSLHVREMENELQAILLDRRSSGVTLTPAGHRLYAFAAPLVRGMDELPARFPERLAEDFPDVLRLGSSGVGATFVLPPYLRQFQERYPGMCVQVRNGLFNDPMKLILDGTVEFVLGAMEPYPENLLDYHPFAPYDMVLITSLEHPLAGRDEVSPEEAAEWPAIVPPGSAYGGRFGQTPARQFGADVHAMIEVSGWRTIKHYVEVGLGISVVPGIVLTKADRLWAIPLDKYFPSRSFGAFTRRGGVLSIPARNLLQLMIPDFPDYSPPPSRARAG